MLLATTDRVGSFTPDELQERRLTLGASEIPAVCGLSKYSNALTIWLSKMGTPAPRSENEQPAEWGLILEPAIAQRYANEHGVSLIQGEKRIHLQEQWMSATPDRLVVKNWATDNRTPDMIDRGLELKNRNAHVAHLFGDSGTDIVPNDIAAQCHWSMMVTGLDTWDVAVLIGGNDWRWYRLNYNAEIAADMQQMGYDFWHKYVLPKVQPPVDGTEMWADHLKRTFAKHTEVMLDATPDDVAVIRELVNVKAVIKDWELKKTLYENQLKNRIGDAAGIISPTGAKVTWRKDKDSTGIDYQAVALELAVTHNVPMEEQKALAEKHIVVTRVGARKLLPSLPKEKK